MTAQEILLLDSTVQVQVGASQLQKIINTMKHFKEKAEINSIINYDMGMEIAEAKNEIVELRETINRLESTTVSIKCINTIDLKDML